MHEATFVIGRFPPPLDGQSMATLRLARLLETASEVHRVNFSTGDSEFAESDVQMSTTKVQHYLNRRRELRERLKQTLDVPVLWASISPSIFGHLRDRLTILPALRTHIQTYAIVHWGNFNQLFSRPLTALSARLMVKQLYGFVFNTQQLANRCAPYIPMEKRFIVPNTVDEAVFFTDVEVETKQIQRRERPALRLLYLSNMTPSKGYQDVLQAVSLLHHSGHRVEADFVGRWESKRDEADFNDHVASHGLQDLVTHHGGVSRRHQVKQFFREADVFLLPTYYPTEAQPLSIIEALNAGTPVITTRHASIPEMVNEGQEAYFIPRQNPQAIADAVERLLPYDHWLELSIGARRRFERIFHPDVVRQAWIDLLNVRDQRIGHW